MFDVLVLLSISFTSALHPTVFMDYHPDRFISATRCLLRDAMLARYTLSSCVCPSVRLTYAGIVPKRLQLG